MAQVDEKGHEGNTVVASSSFYRITELPSRIEWRKDGQGNSRKGVPADYYCLLRTLYHARTAILLSTNIYFEHYYTRTVVGRR